MNYNTISLKKGKEKFLHRKHPWIFSGAFKELPQDFEEGCVVEVLDFKGNFQAMGLFHRKSIAVNILSFEPVENVEQLIVSKLQKALNYRHQVQVLKEGYTDCCRLVFGEGDNLSGLIIDKYADTAVVQIHLEGWIPDLQLIADTLMEDEKINHVFSKPADKISVPHNMIGTLAGESSQTIALEHGHKFNIDWEAGQKTGFFIDQRENRQLLAQYSKGKKVLNTFCYSGGFSVYALQAGAKTVHSVDSSQKAIDLTDANIQLNQFKNHQSFVSDTLTYLKENTIDYDVIILDPPAFAKSKKAQHNAIQGYKRLNLMALKQIKPGGILFTFSCSQAIHRKMFYDTLTAAAIESGRKISVLHHLSQPADHPVNIYHPEGEYLKGLVLYVE